jgi:signal transduction histidine kinase
VPKFIVSIFVFCFIAAFPANAQVDSLSLSLQLAKGMDKRYGQSDQAQIIFEQVLVQAKQKGIFIIQLEAYKQLAQLEILGARYGHAKELVVEALAVAEMANLPIKKAELGYLLATVFHAQGDFTKALERYLESLRVFEALNNPEGSLNTYIALADLYYKQNNFSRAIEFNLKALSLFEKQNDKFRQLNIYERVGALHARQNQFKKAVEYYKNAQRIYKELKNTPGEAAALINMAAILLSENKQEEALNNYQAAYELVSPLHIVPLEVSSLIGMANIYVVLKDYEKANIAYRKCIGLAKPAGLKIELEEAYQGLSEVYKSLKDPGTSKAFRSLSAELKDSLFNDSILKQTSDLQLLYETEKKQAQIELMDKEQKLRSLDLQQTKQEKNFFVALSVLMALLILLFIFFISQNRIINRKLKKGMSDLGLKNAEIELQRAQLDQLNQVKDRFFSIISHDLRNNLTTMKLYFDLVSSPNYKETSSSEMSKQVAASVQNTIDLLENLLVWAAGQIKGVQVEPKKVNLNKLAEVNCQMLFSMAQQKRITLTNDTDEDACIMADENMVHLIIRNLLSNALKFTPEGGSISILSQEEDLFHQIIVIDNGVGMNPEQLETLFTAHANVSTQGTANEKGTGLGLMLCKEFVEKNGGNIWVESEEGKGSSFYFTFPKAS